MNEVECQQKILNLIINNQEFIPEFISEQISSEYFDNKYRCLVNGIVESNRNSNKFTEQYFFDFVARSVSNGDYKKWSGSEVTSSKIALTNEKSIYSNIANLDKCDVADFALICRKVREGFIKKQALKHLESFSSNKNNDYLNALGELSEELTNLMSSSSDTKVASWSSVDEYGEEWLSNLEKEIKNPKKVLSTGIKPFDETMPIGLDIGSLTLIVADVGGFKSGSMINIALNVCKESQENVLYVSLEMPKERLMQRILSREAGVESERISKPNLLTEEEKERLKKAIEDFKNIKSKFSILDAQERMTVSKIRAEIEKRKGFFTPRLVVIDYISILSPDSWYQKLAEHSWYGQMCKDLRQIGRKMGFAVLSAVQLNREAIKSLRNQKDGKQTVGSDALRGSHDFSADADNIFVQFPHPEQPKEKLFLFCVKSRYGSTMFGKNKDENKATLEVNLAIGKMYASVDAAWPTGDNFEASEFIRKGEAAHIENPDLDLSFDPTPPPAPVMKPNKKVTQDDLGF